MVLFFVILALIIVVLLVVITNIVIVPQSMVYVVERLGFGRLSNSPPDRDGMWQTKTSNVSDDSTSPHT